MKSLKVFLLLAVLLGLAVAYYLISPVWRVIEVNEPSPMVTNEQEVGRGIFVAQAHEVAGEALAVLQPDGSQVIRFENFDTINGPDLRIYLSADTTNDDFIDLGPIKATKGSVNYTIPAGVDLTKYDTVLVWCRAFSVLFSYAELN